MKAQQAAVLHPKFKLDRLEISESINTLASGSPKCAVTTSSSRVSMGEGKASVSRS